MKAKSGKNAVFALWLACTILFAALISVSSCGKKNKIQTAPVKHYKPKKTVQTKEKKTKKKYVYNGYKNRNPFFMSGSSPKTAPAAQQEQPSASQGASGYQLTGIMTDISGVRYALLSDSSGGSYILRGGWLYDSEGKKVPSVTGTVFENRIIIIVGKQIKELKLPEEEPPIKLE